MNNSGKTLTIFLGVIVVLLVALTIISVFFFLKEVDLRKSAEYNLDQMKVVEAQLQADIKDSKKQLYVYEEKTKEADAKIESLLEDLELEQGLREEIKKDYRELRDTLDSETQEKETLRSDISKLEEKNEFLQQELSATAEKNKELQNMNQQLTAENEELKAQVGQGGVASAFMDSVDDMTGMVDDELINQEVIDEDVELERIVVNNDGEVQGKVVSVDVETDFLIVNLGEKEGLQNGTVLSVYRSDNYIGDVKVTRVLPEMSAADFIPPLTSSEVRKDDQVMLKQ